MLDALDAGEAAGGDIRGRQSAAILVVPAAGEAWERVVEVRVEDHPEPRSELRRLVELKAAYVVAAEGDELLGAGDVDASAVKYLVAWELAPENIELRFWAEPVPGPPRRVRAIAKGGYLAHRVFFADEETGIVAGPDHALSACAGSTPPGGQPGRSGDSSPRRLSSIRRQASVRGQGAGGVGPT
jgi:Family of unknown function (DUF1028)